MGRGDQVYTLQHFINFQGVYQHHGIDCGDGTVIHLRKRNEVITQSPFQEFTGGKKVYVKHYPLSFVPDVVVHRAQSRLGEEAQYNLLFNNCEHFATWCKLGYAYSQQVRDFIPKVSRLQIEGLSEPLQEALKQGKQHDQQQMVNDALGEIQRVWDQIQPRYKKALSEANTWQKVAWKALQEGKEDVAKAALRRKLNYKKSAEKDEKQLDKLAQMTEMLLKSRSFAQ